LDLQAQLKRIEAVPKTSYRDATAKKLPDLASAVIKEQAERLKRSKSIVIRDYSTAPQCVVQSLDHPQDDISNWLQSHGLSPDDTVGMVARIIPPRTNLLPSQPDKVTIVITLPSIDDRNAILATLKRSVRNSPNCKAIYVDQDLTPAEAKEQQSLRMERNRLNLDRPAEESGSYHYGIRSGRVVKLLH
jgi:hypothetical protein